MRTEPGTTRDLAQFIRICVLRKMNSLLTKKPLLIKNKKSQCSSFHLFISFLVIVSIAFLICFKITRTILSVQVFQFARNQSQILPFSFRCRFFKKFGQQFDLSLQNQVGCQLEAKSLRLSQGHTACLGTTSFSCSHCPFVLLPVSDTLFVFWGFRKGRPLVCLHKTSAPLFCVFRRMECIPT